MVALRVLPFLCAVAAVPRHPDTHSDALDASLSLERRVATTALGVSSAAAENAKAVQALIDFTSAIKEESKLEDLKSEIDSVVDATRLPKASEATGGSPSTIAIYNRIGVRQLHNLFRRLKEAADKGSTIGELLKSDAGYLPALGFLLDSRSLITPDQMLLASPTAIMNRKMLLRFRRNIVEPMSVLHGEAHIGDLHKEAADATDRMMAAQKPPCSSYDS